MSDLLDTYMRMAGELSCSLAGAGRFGFSGSVQITEAPADAEWGVDTSCCARPDESESREEV